MRYVIIHYFVNQRPFKRLGLLQALSTGTVATPNLGGRPRLTEASGLPVKRARNFGSIEGAKQ